MTTLLTLCVAFAPEARASDADRNAVNGSIEIAASERAGSVTTVNGSVRIGERASVGATRTVNGRIKLAADAAAESLRTVNGAMELGRNAKVRGDVTSVNGSLRLEPGAEVGGAVSNVNGRIRLDGATIGGRIKTIGGDIELEGPARVLGGIHVEKPGGWGGSQYKSRLPRIIIGPEAIVEGDLTFEREVELLVSDTAKIGKVVGATPRRFSGARP
jgi:DUF4097 and DUF4098 domain-containing protein YvlB